MSPHHWPRFLDTSTVSRVLCVVWNKRVRKLVNWPVYGPSWVPSGMYTWFRNPKSIFIFIIRLFNVFITKFSIKTPRSLSCKLYSCLPGKRSRRRIVDQHWPQRGDYNHTELWGSRRCDERLKTKGEESARLTYTGFLGELEHLKIETRLIDEMFPSVMGECVFLKW
jgi:hypothetical protein